MPGISARDGRIRLWRAPERGGAAVLGSWKGWVYQGRQYNLAWRISRFAKASEAGGWMPASIDFEVTEPASQTLQQGTYELDALSNPAPSLAGLEALLQLRERTVAQIESILRKEVGLKGPLPRDPRKQPLVSDGLSWLGRVNAANWTAGDGQAKWRNAVDTCPWIVRWEKAP